MYDNDEIGCGAAVILLIIAMVALIFFSPWVVMMGYNAIKLPFNLPDLGYWQFFWVTNALQVLFKTNINMNSNRK